MKTVYYTDSEFHLKRRKIKNMNIISAAFIFFCFLSSFSACKKIIEINPPSTSINAENVYSNDATAIGVLTGLYTRMSSKGINFATGVNSISVLSGLSADEFKLHNNVSNSVLNDYYKNSLVGNTLTGSSGSEFWKSSYYGIYNCNAVINGVSSSTSLTPMVKQQLLGEAKFLRALFYFYLINLYGDAPLITTTDYTLNAVSYRAKIDSVYQFVISDLKDAQQLLSENYLDGSLTNITSERVRPSRWAATALLSRVYLFLRKYAEAENQASIIINNTNTFAVEVLNNVFLKNSKEAIWQLQPVNRGWNTEDARVFVLPTSGPSNSFPVYLSNQILDSFEPGDLRSIPGNWINKRVVGANIYYYPFKYKSAKLNDPVTEYLMVLRLGEVFLIRAEARANLNNLAGAISDIDIIRNRAGLPLISNSNPLITKSDLLNKISHERQVELFSEWGYRWMDLKRSGEINTIMNVATTLKGGIWNATSQLYPIPYDDIQKNKNLTQNPGY